MAPANNNNRRRNNNQRGRDNEMSRPIKCCVPSDCLFPGKFIYAEDLGTSDVEVVKVYCNNDHCQLAEYMHKECFEVWEQTVLAYLRSCGRARSWSERQRLQNVWTKKGYDLAFKACSCRCGKGHVRKDLNWTPPHRTAPIPIPAPPQPAQPQRQVPAQVQDDEPPEAAAAAVPEQQQANVEAGKKKKKSKAKEQRPTLAISAPIPHPNNNHSTTHVHVNRQGSLESGYGSSAPRSTGHAPPFGSLGSSSSGSFDLSSSLPSSSSGMLARSRINSVSSNGSGSSASSNDNEGSPPSPLAMSPQNLMGGVKFQQPRKGSKGAAAAEVPDRTRRDSGGIFTRRLDFSSFNRLPRHKLNSYHIKMEDESHGNDDTRNFVLNTLMTAKINRVSCILCFGSMAIFDRYPLIDGTFFLSPRQHSMASFEIRQPGGRIQFLSAVCMGCLEGWYSHLFCRRCNRQWDGSDLVLGTCYTYDIFAATPCCEGRTSCSRCSEPLMFHRPTMFSEYSQSYCCHECGLVDYHVARPLPEVFIKTN